MVDFEDDVFKKLISIQASKPALIATELDVEEEFGLARSFRRGAVSRAGAQGVAEADIVWMNRWRTKKIGDDNKGGINLRTRYSDNRLLLSRFLRFSAAL